MHTAAPAASNPFALMLTPEAVFQAIERSERLGGLQARICRPLDKPLIPKVGEDVAAFDAQVDDEAVGGSASHGE